MLSKDFLLLVLLSSLVALPVAWWAMSSWLESNKNRIDIEWWMFAIAFWRRSPLRCSPSVSRASKPL
jgi:hypothetical protein